MKYTTYIFTIVLLIYSCSKYKSDARKIIGSWKREFRNGMTGQLISIDTIYFDKTHCKQYNELSSYYLKNDSLVLIKNFDTLTYCYRFSTNNILTIRCFSFPDEALYFNLRRI